MIAVTSRHIRCSNAVPVLAGKLYISLYTFCLLDVPLLGEMCEMTRRIFSFSSVECGLLTDFVFQHFASVIAPIFYCSLCPALIPYYEIVLLTVLEVCHPLYINHLTPNGHYVGHTAQLTSRCCILYIYSTNIRTEYFKHAT